MRAYSRIGGVLVAVDWQFESALKVAELSLRAMFCANHTRGSLGPDGEEVIVVGHINVIFKYARDITEESEIVDPLNEVNIH